jgi:hypothetical protein
MRIRIKVQEETYFIKLLSILNNIPPFDKLRPKELELYAHLLTVNHRYRNIPLPERNKLIFTYDVKIDIANKMGIKLSGVYNILNNLRSYKILGKESLFPKYALYKVKELVFIFDDNEE